MAEFSPLAMLTGLNRAREIVNSVPPELYNYLRSMPQEQGPTMMPSHQQGTTFVPTTPFPPSMPTGFMPMPQEEPKKIGLNMSPSAISMLATGGQVGMPAPPNIQTGGKERQVQQTEVMPTPQNLSQLMGGQSVGQFLQMPQQVSFQMPQLPQTGMAGMSPEIINSALNTTLAYKQAEQQARQQNFQNKLSQAGFAAGMDDREVQRFVQKHSAEAQQLSNQQSRLGIENYESPQEQRLRNLDSAMRLASYNGQLDLAKEQLKYRQSLATGKYTEGIKMQLQQAWKIVDEYRNSMPGVDMAEAIKTGNMDAIFSGLNGSAPRLQTPQMIASLKWAVETIQGAGQISSGEDIGIGLKKEPDVINGEDYMRMIGIRK